MQASTAPIADKDHYSQLEVYRNSKGTGSISTDTLLNGDVQSKLKLWRREKEAAKAREKQEKEKVSRTKGGHVSIYGQTYQKHKQRKNAQTAEKQKIRAGGRREDQESQNLNQSQDEFDQSRSMHQRPHTAFARLGAEASTTSVQSLRLGSASQSHGHLMTSNMNMNSTTRLPNKNKKAGR